jgi:hypothetical protein
MDFGKQPAVRAAPTGTHSLEDRLCAIYCFDHALSMFLGLFSTSLALRNHVALYRSLLS